jgi:hypothetical protein
MGGGDIVGFFYVNLFLLAMLIGIFFRLAQLYASGLMALF